MCRENSSDLDSDFIDSASEALCGRCSNLPESDKLMNHYKYFDCHQIWKQDQMAEVIAFGKHPYLREFGDENQIEEHTNYLST